MKKLKKKTEKFNKLKNKLRFDKLKNCKRLLRLIEKKLQFKKKKVKNGNKPTQQTQLFSLL